MKQKYVARLASSALLGAALWPAGGAIAAETEFSVEPTNNLLLEEIRELADDKLAPETASSQAPDSLLLQDISELAGEEDPEAAFAQVRSVSELTDISPTDWAFQAVRSLVERYQCLEGFPDNTFRGDRPLTRYEFAAALNKCLNRVIEIVSGDVIDLPDDDLSTIGELQEEFRAELAALDGRVARLEDGVAKVEANQFSITTKLAGEAVVNIADVFGDGDDNQTVLQARARLNFNTSFTGRDLLITRLQTGNVSFFDLTNANSGVGFGSGTAEGVFSSQVFGDTGGEVVLDTLEYIFPIGDRISVAIAANAGIFDDFTPTLNPFFEDFDGGSGSISAFAQRSPIYRLGGGAGIGVSFKPIDGVEITGGYLASGGADPSEGAGLFNGDYAALGQITLTPVDGISVAFTYNRAYFTQGNFGFDNGGGLGGFTGTSLVNNLGAANEISSDSFGGAVEIAVAKGFQVNGWFAYTDAELLDDDLDAEIWTGAIALGFPDLLKSGSLGGIVVGFQPYLGGLEDNNQFFENDMPIHVEGFYKLQLSDNISVTPGLIWLLAPNQDEDNDDSVVVTLRTTFLF